MKSMRVTLGEDGTFVLVSRDKYLPAMCAVSNLRFHDTEPLLQMDIDWISKGGYTNGQRKKMVARTLVRLLRAAVAREKSLLQHTKETNV